MGMPKELIGKIFDPFFTTKPKGHGLGLATCHSIISRHDGCIEVDTEPGKGSVFHVYLPAEKGSVATTEERSAVKHAGSGTILIMDDEEIIRNALSEVLTHSGYTVVCKDNGRETLDYAAAAFRANEPFSAMIFDLTLPGGMGGKEVAAEIRKINQEVPILVASGYADDPVMKNPREYGFTDSLCKPFQNVELIEALQKIIKT
jgi:CheY-like chemotaxis protein